VVADSVKGVHVGSATWKTKEPHGVADTGHVCMLEMLPGEQRNYMGWRTLRSAHTVGVLQNGHQTVAPKGGGAGRERAADAIKCTCVISATSRQL